MRTSQRNCSLLVIGSRASTHSFWDAYKNVNSENLGLPSPPSPLLQKHYVWQNSGCCQNLKVTDGKTGRQIWKTLVLLGTMEIISTGYNPVLPQGKYVSLIASVNACSIELDLHSWNQSSILTWALQATTKVSNSTSAIPTQVSFTSTW